MLTLTSSPKSFVIQTLQTDSLWAISRPQALLFSSTLFFCFITLILHQQLKMERFYIKLFISNFFSTIRNASVVDQHTNMVAISCRWIIVSPAEGSPIWPDYSLAPLAWFLQIDIPVCKPATVQSAHFTDEEHPRIQGNKRNKQKTRHLLKTHGLLDTEMVPI